jgi:methionine biosynthesis protein MetW
LQGGADAGLEAYPDDAFDYVILSRTLHATRQPCSVHMPSIGCYAIVSFPNFGHRQIRLQIFFGGHMPHADILMRECSNE